MYDVYLIREIKSGETYIGFTSDLDRRLKEHERNKGEIELMYCESYKDSRDARDRERKLKQRGQSVRWLKERIQRSLE